MSHLNFHTDVIHQEQVYPLAPRLGKEIVDVLKSQQKGFNVCLSLRELQFEYFAAYDELLLACRRRERAADFEFFHEMLLTMVFDRCDELVASSKN